MLAKKTIKNQITLPKKIVDRFPGVEYFNVRTEDDRIVLEPLRMDRAGQAREKLARLGINEADIAMRLPGLGKRNGEDRPRYQRGSFGDSVQKRPPYLAPRCPAKRDRHPID
jgi:preprotein translocase subunit SecD